VCSIPVSTRTASPAWRFDPSLNQYDVPRTTAFYNRLLDEVRAVPGVQSAGLVENVPLTLGWSTSAMWFEGGRWDTAERPLELAVNAVSEATSRRS
jgi:hypothetical protein